MLPYPLNAPPTSLVSVFTFTAGSLPLRPLSFIPTKPKCTKSRKRTRPLSDLDDQPIPTSKKKRRLRLLLITSRLSRPFSTPATHIVDRGSSKIAVWAKKKHLVPQALRKAAIMNRVRILKEGKEAWLRKDSGISVGEDEKAETRRTVLEEMKLEGPNAFNIGYPPPGRHLLDNYVAPSPLGLSNYDALDDEDDYGYYDEESEDGSVSGSPRKYKMVKRERDDDGDGAYYSDWSILDNGDATREEEDEDEYDDPFSLSVLPTEIAKEKRPPSPPDGAIIELLKEKERQREVLFLEFG